MVVPTFSLGLLAAAQARPTTGSITGPVNTSESQRESNPRSSRPVTSSVSASGLDAAPAAPTPMRIFMSRLLFLTRARVLGQVVRIGLDGWIVRIDAGGAEVLDRSALESVATLGVTLPWAGPVRPVECHEYQCGAPQPEAHVRSLLVILAAFPDDDIFWRLHAATDAGQFVDRARQARQARKERGGFGLLKGPEPVERERHRLLVGQVEQRGVIARRAAGARDLGRAKALVIVDGIDDGREMPAPSVRGEIEIDTLIHGLAGIRLVPDVNEVVDDGF